MSLDYITLTITPFSQNCRIFYDRETKRGVVVDPGGESGRVLSALEKLEVTVDAILLTHAHLDHAGGVLSLRAGLKRNGVAVPPLMAHRAERELRNMVSQSAAMFGLNPLDFENVPEPDIYLEDGDEVMIGASKGTVLFTPGHSPGHVSVYVENVGADGEAPPLLIAGDVLFQGSVGRTDLPGGDFSTLMKSITTKLLPLPDQTVVLSGHGAETTIGAERKTNPFLVGRLDG